MNYDVLSEKIVHQHHFTMKLVKYQHDSFSGGEPIEVTREVFDRGSSVGVILFDPDREIFVLVEQIRAGAVVAGLKNPWILEVVAGSLDRDIFDQEEDPEQAGLRECQEEIGYTPEKLTKIQTVMPSPGGCSEIMHLYYGEIDSSKVADYGGLLEHGEDIRVRKITLDAMSIMLGHQSRNHTMSAPLVIGYFYTLLTKYAEYKPKDPA